MGYSPSPRPTFDGPAAIPFQSVTRHLWGDPVSGEVADWIYVSSGLIHQLVFGLPPGGAFLHSENFRTVFAADELLYVLGGVMALANPETGEVHRVLPGEAAFFRRDTWHHAFNQSSEPLRVLELFAPPPAQGTSGAYSRTKPILAAAQHTQDQYLGRWPMARAEAAGAHTIQVLRENDMMWRLEGEASKTLVGVWISTEHLTVGQIELMPGQHTDLHTHGGDESLYQLSGTLHVHTPANNGQSWFELGPRDGFYVPQGVPHQYYNVSAEPARLLFAVAPCYLPAAA
jgi:quercetin dioxygenase-like cupin family protein